MPSKAIFLQKKLGLTVILQKLAKCSFVIFLIGVHLVKPFLDFVAGYDFYKPIRPFGEMGSHMHKI